LDAAGASDAERPTGLSACISARQGGGYRCNPLRGDEYQNQGFDISLFEVDFWQ